MIKKEYKAITYGLRYKDFVKILNHKAYQTRGCKLIDINSIQNTSVSCIITEMGRNGYSLILFNVE